MKQKYYIYLYIDPLSNQPFYIGKGTKNRAYYHLKETKEKSENKRKFYKIQKLLKQNTPPIIKIYKNNLPENQAYELEKKLISKYGRKGYDLNGTLLNICIDNHPPSWKGKHLSNQAKKKIGDFNRNKIVSKATCLKMSESLKGRTAWNKGLKLPEKYCGKNHPMFGKHHTEKTKELIRQKLKIKPPNRVKTFEILTPKNENITITNLSKFCRENNLKYGSLYNTFIRKTNATYKGWKIMACTTPV